MEGLGLWEILVIVELVLSFHGGWGKECTNIPTMLSSHTLRAQYLDSHSHASNEDMLFHDHLTPTDESAWANLLPRKILGNEGDEFYWAMTYRKIKNSWSRFDSSKDSATGDNGGGSVDNFLKEFSLHDVRLSAGSLHSRAQQTNLEYLLMLDVDRLVWSFRKNAGLETIGMPYGGWEELNSELRGHFVGHYLSASARMWASTGNNNLKEKMSSIVSALSACQEKIGTGYLSAFPSEFFDRFEAIESVWAPYYTIHKIMAGLLDQYSYVGDSQALKMVTGMAEYFYMRVKNVILLNSIEQHWKSLNEETGGMNDVLYKLYAISGNQKHLFLAHLFDKPCFLGMLAVEADSLSGFHANTHIPIVIGSQMRYEITGDSLYKKIGSFFMNIVNSSHTYATGGTSINEFWSNPKRLATTLKSENEESCTTYNMLKVSRHLFTWTKEMAYADYYERALTNGVLSIQRGSEAGKMIYMLPLAAGSSKAKSIHGWGNATGSFWCCYGTGIESFSKLADSIYFEGEQATLYVIQYISSSLDWKSAKMLIDQKVSPVTSVVRYLQATFTISSKGASPASVVLNMRIPTWSSSIDAAAYLNGQKSSLVQPGNFHSFPVKSGDTLTLQLPISLRSEAIKDDRPEYASIQAILYGPYLLAGLTSGDWDIKTGQATSISDWITPIPAMDYNSNLISLFHESAFVLTNSNRSITMENIPYLGTDASVHATFRLILVDSKSQSSSFIGQKVRMESFDYPGMVLAPQGTDLSLVVAEFKGNEKDSVFQVVGGRNGKEGYVSLESESHEGCFVYSGENFASGQKVKLNCTKGSDGMSFIMKKGFQEYDQISFVAKGARRNFLLSPLLSLRDESYTVYFNIQA